jgi:dihydropteroate synthase
VNASRPVLWGVLNVTPDSFSDGGQFFSPDLAIAQATLLIEHGAGVIDVGGESTRPGAQRVAPEVEQERVIPVIEALAKRDFVVGWSCRPRHVLPCGGIGSRLRHHALARSQ